MTVRSGPTVRLQAGWYYTVHATRAVQDPRSFEIDQHRVLHQQIDAVIVLADGSAVLKNRFPMMLCNTQAHLPQFQLSAYFPDVRSPAYSRQ